ncbi:PepSY domain-containing protein [Sphingomonas sp. BGYR3]|uniref:PepSY-associated TM helix domain-containing protein n=1 Tax=Sphingomonas sp. BGYR3 TaxID=2975483 RepID=UPI0021A71221|nr:PepSY domain-containing protein [Sphingomonas sp. BGYR3]MDG5487204.1 PepSY domain-containing protein [Sphingomonas sp. BGYR3]
MTRESIRVWFLVHKWSSILCTAFLLMLCVTGLPLIFHDEIDALTGHDPISAMQGVPSSSDAPGQRSLDDMLAKGLAQRPGEVPVFMAFDNASPVLTVTTAPRPDSPASDMTVLLFNRTTGEPAGAASEDGVMHFILQLHTDMFLGLPGMLFLGAMGLLFVIALVSGVVLYAPFMRKLDFGTLRTRRSRRVKWLDTHNLLGITALVWASVVGVTGIIHTLATPIIQGWQQSELADMTAAYAGRAPLPPARYGSIDRAMAAARAALPGTNPQFIAFPGGSYSSAHHMAVFMQGNSPLTQRLLTPALIDGETGTLTDARPLPWYVQALLYSQPLHFGDYGGLPLKILWAILDVFTILVLGSGLYLWLGRRRGADAPVREVETGGIVPATAMLPEPAE